MEALNAAGLTPLSVLSDRRKDPRKSVSLPTVSAFKKSSNSMKFDDNVSRNLHGGLVFLSSVFTTGLANALTYEEALQQSVESSTPDLDTNAVLDGITSFAADNPVVLVGGLAVLAVPLIVSRLLSKPKPWGVESAKTAYSKLADDATAQLIDIRSPLDARQMGSPDISGLKKKVVSVVYKGEDKMGFLNKLSLKFKEPENTTLLILDKFDGNSELVAELVTANGYKAAYAIKDGAEGPRGWVNSGLPWLLPKKGFSLDFSSLTDSIGDALGEGADAVSVTLGIAAAAGLGLLAFSEVETLLQLLGSAAIIQVFSKKLLFAEDRNKTLKEVDEYLNTKIAPKELFDEIKQIGKALLPSSDSSKALPAPTETPSTAAVVSDTTPLQVAESVPQVNDTPSNVEAVAEPTPDISDASTTESHSGTSRPLSPYACYPDFKPPSSPMPSQP
ncbi:hypothetical protein Leryth_008459 [Lithospermum erythrorhizon]|nr:hypothetical protein Leryth_008459 [Lithospermum erythrorhizon]